MLQQFHLTAVHKRQKALVELGLGSRSLQVGDAELFEHFNRPDAGVMVALLGGVCLPV
ncbi:hypothetical protein [Mesorhizobium tamadayense]|uniref:hypothetical protein n=1 Tax=Mesorhizobium tamadayense TaxID=425306 RepID=UPI00142E36DD|nr:hypothetical protein [Mesorhizobium tamadayense]